MKTIAACVEDLVKHQPFVEDALSRKIINYSALAEDFQPRIEQMVGKKVNVGSIVMALRRYFPQKRLNDKMVRNLGDVTVRSGITEFTFLNSVTILDSQSRLLEEVRTIPKAYFTYSSTFHESNILVSNDLTDIVERCFASETRITIKPDLSSISIELPENNSKTVGLYFYIFKLLAYEGIPVFEVISTSNYFTLFLEKEYVNQAFALINEIKN
ncbi:MAG: hypothetical protein CL868_12075 [Cytophagaceae bacterium]|nr:hypothetical protein [Cytophagaceae bacterium]